MSRTDPPRASLSRVALLGGGERAADLIHTVRTLCPTGERLAVVAVCDADATSPALVAAREAGVPHVGRLVANVLNHGDVDVLIDLRNVSEPGFGVLDMIPPGMQVFGSQGVDLLRNMLELTRESERALDREHDKLEDTRAHLDQLMALAPFSIYVKDTDLNYVLMNNTALALLGLESADVLGKSDFDLFPNAVARRIRAREKQVLQDLQPATFQGVLPLKNDDRMYFSATIFPIVRDDKPIALFGLIEDITELHDSERRLVDRNVELTETREELKGILENSQDIIFVLQPNGRLKSYNKSAENVFGPKRDEVKGRTTAPFVDDSAEFERLFRTALSDGHASSYELQMSRYDGGDVIVNTSLTRVNDPKGRPLEVVVICRDITERLKLREDLIQSERLAAIGKMAAGVAHEINNPLAIIEALAGVMEDTLAEADCDDDPAVVPIRECIKKLYVQTGRCTSITHNLLGFARRNPGVRSLVSIPALLNQSLDLLRSESKRIDLEVKRRFAPGLPPVQTDPQLLEQIFVNLLKNAMDAIEEKKPEQALIELNVSLLENPGDASMCVAVTITDNGVGIPEKNLGQVFDLFYTSKPAGKGTGLGLSIVHNILKKIDGEIRLESEQGKGSSFTVILPLSS